MVVESSHLITSGVEKKKKEINLKKKTRIKFLNEFILSFKMFFKKRYEIEK